VNTSLASFEKDTGNLVHQSGRFFRIEGIDVRTNFGPTAHWMQPIINQPEIGILGFLAKRIEGVVHLLVQAKMEPGNVNLVQVSPTVQATRSNYTQVHGGKRPCFLEYFLLDQSRARVIEDQLQSEQGSRFLRKRNRNMIVEVAEDEPVEVPPDFLWVTLGQLHELLRLDNVVNMDSRTVLSSIRYAVLPSVGSRVDSREPFWRDVLRSAWADESESELDLSAVQSWITSLKVRYELEVQRIPLRDVRGWICDDWAIFHEARRYFQVIGVSVFAGNREVTSWRQPLIRSLRGGILCFICQKRRGVLSFLVQGRVEPGHLDVLELAPTLQCTPGNYDPTVCEHLPPFFQTVLEAPPEWVRVDSIQSEEGGRFYQDQNRYLVLELPEEQELGLPANYAWMSLRQMKELIRFNNYFNVEARGLIACLG
jgi:oxidase EvaA